MHRLHSSTQNWPSRPTQSTPLASCTIDVVSASPARRTEPAERALPRVLAVIAAALFLCMSAIFTSCDGMWFGINSGYGIDTGIGAYIPIDGWGGDYSGPIGPPPPPPMGGPGAFRPHYNSRPFIP